MFVISKQLNSNCRHRENLGRKLCVAPSGRGGTNFGVTCNAQITTHWSVCWVQLCNVVVFRDESLNFSNCARYRVRPTQSDLKGQLAKNAMRKQLGDDTQSTFSFFFFGGVHSNCSRANNYENHQLFPLAPASRQCSFCITSTPKFSDL